MARVDSVLLVVKQSCTSTLINAYHPLLFVELIIFVDRYVTLHMLVLLLIQRDKRMILLIGNICPTSVLSIFVYDGRDDRRLKIFIKEGTMVDFGGKYN